MGETTRQGRCERFIQVFNRHMKESIGIKDGDDLRVLEVRLGYDDIFSIVRFYVDVEAPWGEKLTLSWGEPIYDPDVDSNGELVDRIAKTSGMMHERAAELVKKVDPSL